MWERAMDMRTEYPRVYYLAALPEHWVIRSAPDTCWLVAEQQAWAGRSRYDGPVTDLQTTSPQTARLVLEQLGLPTGAYALPNESQSHYETIAG
jgi:hypothetical protein